MLVNSTLTPCNSCVISWTRYKIYQPSFQARYIHFFSHETEQNLQHAYPWQNLDAASLKWLPLLFIMVSRHTPLCSCSR